MSIAQNILEIVEHALQDEDAPRVDKVVVRIGAMVSIVPDSLTFCYEAITEGTHLAGSTLVIEEVPARVRCKPCNKTTQIDSFVFRCEHCGGTDLTTESGHELAVSHIEVH
jgi:hydrogenase nickel incorporation protein HypA/HybF